MTFSSHTKDILFSEINRMDLERDNFSKRPGLDFSRNRKLGFKDLIRFQISIKSGSVNHELMKYFCYHSSLFPPLAAVVAVALFSRFSNLLLRSRLYALAERKVLRKRNTIGGAVNRRSPKNAFSEAASIFGLRLPLRGLKGASSPFLVDPARRNRWCFSGSLLARKRELSPNAKVL